MTDKEKLKLLRAIKLRDPKTLALAAQEDFHHLEQANLITRRIASDLIGEMEGIENAWELTYHGRAERLRLQREQLPQGG